MIRGVTRPPATVRHSVRILDDRRLWQPIVLVGLLALLVGFLGRRLSVPEWAMMALFIPAGIAAYRLRRHLPAGVGRRATPRIATAGASGTTRSVSDLWLQNRHPRADRFLERAPWFIPMSLGAIFWYALTIPGAAARPHALDWDGTPITVVLSVEDSVDSCPALGVLKLVESRLYREPGVRFAAPSTEHDSLNGLYLPLSFSCEGHLVRVQSPVNPRLASQASTVLLDPTEPEEGLATIWGLAPRPMRRLLPDEATAEYLLDLDRLDQWARHGGVLESPGTHSSGIQIHTELGLLGPAGPWPGPPKRANLHAAYRSGLRLDGESRGAEELLSRAAMLTWSGVPPYEGPELAQIALNLVPSSPLAWLTLAEAQAASNRWVESLASFERAMTISPHLVGPRLGLARGLRNTRQYIRALDVLEPLLAGPLPHPAAALEAGWTNLIGRGDLVEAARLAALASEGAVEEDIRTGARELQAQIAYYRGDWSRHQDLLSSLAASAPSRPQSWEYRVQSLVALWIQGRTSLVQAGALRLSREMEDYEEMEDSDQGTVPVYESVRIQALFGLTLALLGDIEEGKRQGLAALQRLPLTEHGLLGPEQHWTMATIHLIAGEEIPAIDGFGYSTHVPSRYSRALVQLDPMMRPLMDQPTFLEIVRRVPSIPTGFD